MLQAGFIISNKINIFGIWMNILLTNDDGINAGGINVIYDLFSEHHNVYMIAPDRERSA